MASRMPQTDHQHTVICIRECLTRGLLSRCGARGPAGRGCSARPVVAALRHAASRVAAQSVVFAGSLWLTGCRSAACLLRRGCRRDFASPGRSAHCHPARGRAVNSVLRQRWSRQVAAEDLHGFIRCLKDGQNRVWAVLQVRHPEAQQARTASCQPVGGGGRG